MSPLPRLLAAAAALIAAVGIAQTGAPAGAAGDRPALESYRPFADQDVSSWKEANDTVGRIGGWRAYAREAQAAASAPAAPASAAPAAKDPHAGHH